MADSGSSRLEELRLIRESTYKQVPSDKRFDLARDLYEDRTIFISSAFFGPVVDPGQHLEAFSDADFAWRKERNATLINV